MAREPEYGVPLTADDISLGLPIYPIYGVTPSNEYIPLKTDGTGILQVGATFSGSITIGEIGTDDRSGFTYGASLEQPIGGVFQETGPSLSSGQTGAVRLTQFRAFHTNLRDAAGNQLLGQDLSADSLPVVIASDQSTLPVSISGTVPVSGTIAATQSGIWTVSISSGGVTTSDITSVAASITSVEILAANSDRKMATIYNDSTSIMYVALGSPASLTNFTARLQSNDYYELPLPIYPGSVNAIWVTATGNARVTELS